MITIKEVKDENRSIFLRTHTNDNDTLLLEENVYFRIYKTMLNMNPVWILYDDDMKVISEVYKYINIQMAGQADNSKEKAVYAFRLLYCFLKLFKATV